MQIEKIKQLYKLFSIVPLKSKKSKSPFWDDWTKHCKERVEFSKIENHTGIFGICGGFEGIEFIDIDNDLLTADELFKFVSDNYDLSNFPVTKTQSGGYHIYYKCDNPKNDKKLARKIYTPPEKHVFEKEIKIKTKDGIKEVKKRYCNLLSGKERAIKDDGTVYVTLIETRGKGGQVVFYDNFINGDIENVPKISDEERDILFDVCRSQNEIAEKEKKQNTNKSDSYQESPGDMYLNDPGTINETINLLLSNGWTTKNNIYWWRPGKDFRQSPSATFGKVGINKFYNFSENGDPFPSRESITMFGVRAILKHNGDFSSCARELAEHYGILGKQRESGVKRNQPDNDSKPITSASVKWDILKQICKEWKLQFRYNQLTGVLDYSNDGGKKYIDDTDQMFADIVAEMEINRGVKSISKAKIADMVSSSVICHVYNPILKFFKSLPEWDGVDYFKELEKYLILDIDEDVEFFFTMLKKHLIRAVKCAGIPDYVNRFVFVMFGPQEIGKTLFFRWLLPEKDLYFEEHIKADDKDSILALARYLFINLDELDELNKKDVSKLKSFISKGKITKRVSYGKHDRNFNRIASFFGSTNKSDLLADDHNTRWLIFKILKFDWEGYVKNLNPLQIWAQVVSELKKNTNSGELTKIEKEKRDSRNDSDFLQISQERELLLAYFSEGKTPMTSTDIKYLIELKKHPLKVNEYGLRRELRRLFGEPAKPTREDNIKGEKGHMGRYYYLKTELFDEGINSYVNNTFGEQENEVKVNKQESMEFKQDSMEFDSEDIPF